jgi:hypothetical protein
MATISHSHKAIEHYYADLREYAAQGVTHEGAIRTAFQTLLATLAREVGWTLIPELPLDNGRRPDGTLRDQNQYTRGYWEAKDSGDHLATEISKKIVAGYPTINTIFEDTRQAMLYQNSVLVDTFDLSDARQLAGLSSALFAHASIVSSRAAPLAGALRVALALPARELPALARGLPAGAPLDGRRLLRGPSARPAPARARAARPSAQPTAGTWEPCASRAIGYALTAVFPGSPYPPPGAPEPLHCRYLICKSPLIPLMIAFQSSYITLKTKKAMAPRQPRLGFLF